jgi:hypothetical protein
VRLVRLLAERGGAIPALEDDATVIAGVLARLTATTALCRPSSSAEKGVT